MLTHKGTQTLRTDRLILRRFTIDDAQEMFDNWANDERVTKFLTWQPHKNPEKTKELLKDWIKTYEDPTTYNWLIDQRCASRRKKRVRRSGLLHWIRLLEQGADDGSRKSSY